MVIEDGTSMLSLNVTNKLPLSYVKSRKNADPIHAAVEACSLLQPQLNNLR